MDWRQSSFSSTNTKNSLLLYSRSHSKQLKRKRDKRNNSIKDTHSSAIQKRYVQDKLEKALNDSPKDMFKMKRFKDVPARISPRGNALKKAGEQTMKLP